MSAPKVEVAQIAGAPLVDRLLAGDPAVLALYGGHPLHLASYAAKLAEVRRRFDRPARARAAAALRPTSARAAERIARFVEEGGAVVTTGQQAGLFTGPMYTINKALTAVRLAQALESQLGVIVLPVFWVASEDHDFAEVNHAWAVDPRGGLERVAVRPTSPLALPMSRMTLGADVETALNDFSQLLSPQSDGGDDLTALRSAYRPGVTVAAAFTEALAALLAPFDVCLTDAADPALKAASAPVLLHAAEDARTLEHRVARRTREVEALGLSAPVTLVPKATNLFLDGGAGRERLHREGEDFVAPESGERLTRHALRAAIESAPGRFSPNVLLRPVVESAVFPTLAYIGGPAETAYFAQIGPLFAAAGIQPPVAFPRYGARIVPAEVDRAVAALGLPDRELSAPEHVLLERLARERLPAGVAEALAALRRELVDRFAALADASAGIDPNLAMALGARRNRALLEAAAAERKIIRHLKRNDRALGRDLRLARNHLWPNGAPQERTLTTFQYLATTPDLLARLSDAIGTGLSGILSAAPPHPETPLR